MIKKNGQNLDELRKKIDEVDDEILRLLNERAKIVKKVGEIKKKIKANFYVPNRETEIIKRLQSKSKGYFPKNAIKPVFREIISACLSLEKPLKVGYLGPQATFTHEAAIKYFGQGAQYIAFRSISEIFDEVYKSRVDMGVVPVENSTEGVVSHTLDMFLNYDLRISGEIIIPITHCLLSRAYKKEEIKTIYSHSQAFAQCRNWIEKNLAHCTFIETRSTAEAAEMASKDERSGAIAGESASKLYDLNILERNIQDVNDNSTRFLIIGKVSHKPTGNDKTTILFSIKDEAGALYNMLAPFAKRRINLTKIESRPIKTKAWEYVFFLDLDGHEEDKNVSEALKELKKQCIFLKIAGSYPKFNKEALK